MDTRITVPPTRTFLPLLCACVLLGGCSGDGPAATRELPVVAVARAELQDSYRLEHEYTGLLAAAEHDDVGFELGGTLQKVEVDEGDHVKSGQLLALLDTQLLDAERRQLEAALEESAARARLVDTNLAREQKLKRSGFAAEQRIDELRAEQQALAATHQRLHANLESNTVRLAKSRLEAPFDGVITRRYRDTGAPVVPGTPVLRIMDSATPEARVGVPARLAPQLEPGARLAVQIVGQSHEARVIARGADIDPVTRTLMVRLALPALTGVAEGELLALRVAEDVAQVGTWLPITAITEGLRGLWVVYVLVRQPEEGVYRIESRDVSVLHAGEERVFVSGALATGELVVSGALQRVAPGQRVRLAAATGA